MVQEYTLEAISRWVLKCAKQALNLIRADRGGLPIARAKTPNLPAKKAGTPVLGSPYPTTKASCQVLPGGLEKITHILGIFFLDILLPLFYIRLILKQVLIIYH